MSMSLDEKGIKSGMRRWLPLFLLAGLLLPFLGSTWYVLSLERRLLEEGFIHDINRLADVLADGMSQPVLQGKPELGQPFIDFLMADQRVVHVQVETASHGAFLAGGSVPDEASLAGLLLLRRDIAQGDAGIGEIRILVDVSTVHEALYSQHSEMLAYGAGAVLLSLAIVLVVFRVFTRLENEANLRSLNRALSAEIAERSATEERLQESEAHIQAIMENSPSAIMMKDLDGRYRVVNARVCEWHGLAAEQLIGKTSQEIFPFADAVGFVSHDREALALDRAVTREYQLRWKDGTGHTVVSTKFPVRDRAENLIGVGTLYTDITDQRRAEEQLRQTQKMQSLGQLTGGVAHDFNNLLAVIQGNAEMLDEDIDDRSGEMDRSLRAIYRAVQRGKELTLRLLAFSRRQPLSPMPVDMQEMASGMTAMLQRTFGETIRIREETSAGDWRAMTDPGQLENAILNLGINARDAMPGGGEIVIRTAARTITDGAESVELDLPPGDYVAISVADTGYGMPADIVEKSIEPFFTTKDVGEGTGLGLSMVYGFAKQSAGGMTIESEEGKGTTVTLFLPRAMEEADAADTDAGGDVGRGGGETILLVEDDVELRRVARGLLEGLGYEVIAAEDARDGMARLATAGKVDLLLTDIVLPGGFSGPDLAEAARGNRPGLKVLFMSGYAERVTRNHPLPPGARMLSKPFQRSELARVLREELDARAETVNS